MIARNHHYVPRFILRHFLSDAKKEQVTVFDKQAGKTFRTAVENIMAERDFHAFVFDDTIVSFENIASHIEDICLPAYEKVIAERRLDGTPEQKAALAFLVAFQFLRTKSQRTMQKELEVQLRDVLAKEGSRLEDLINYTPLTPDVLKESHVRSFREDTGIFAQLVAEKDFVLQAAAPGRTFYLSDHPVVLNNHKDHAPYGNIGFGVEGIEIYMPLSSDLMLCALCPSLARESRELMETAKHIRQQEALAELIAGRISALQMREHLDTFKPNYEPTEEFLSGLEQGVAVSSVDASMDYLNSLQARHAARFIVAQDGNFDLAIEMNSRYPGEKGGLRFTI